MFDVNCRLCVQFEIACSAGGIGGINNEDPLNFRSEDSIKLCNKIKYNLLGTCSGLVCLCWKLNFVGEFLS